MMTQLKLFKPSRKPWKPREDQKKGVEFLLTHACGGLFADPGVGKTSISLAAIKLLKVHGVVKRVLIVAPLRVCRLVWPVEVEKWLDFHHLRVAVLHGADKEMMLRSEADIYIINPDGLDWLLDAKKTTLKNGKRGVSVNVAQFARLGFDTLIVDELSKFKHTNTVRFKALKQVLHTFRRRWGLTGTPAANGLLNLFGQCYVLDMGNALGQYITHYRLNYFKPDYSGFVWTLQQGAEQRIYDKIAPLVLRLSAEGLPQLTSNIIHVDLPDEVMKIYNELEELLLTQVEHNTVTAANVGVASMKCRQIASGGIYLDPADQLIPTFTKKRDWKNLHTVKIDALADLIEELQGSPLLVAYDFNHDLDRLKTKFGKDLPYIGAGVSAKCEEELIHAWNSGKLPVLYGHPQAIGHGLNLQEAGHHVCWLSLTWDYELYDQFIRRVYRQGNRHQHVFVHHIVARGTVDEIVMVALGRKAKCQQALFDGLKAHQKQRLK